MSDSELLACTAEEYMGNETRRVQEGAIAVNSVYTIMLSSRAMPPAYEFVKCPARIVAHERLESSVYRVSFDFLNVDLQLPTGLQTVHSTLVDGYLRAKSDNTSGYFRNYSATQRGQELAAIVARGIEVPSLVAVG